MEKSFLALGVFDIFIASLRSKGERARASAGVGVLVGEREILSMSVGRD